MDKVKYVIEDGESEVVITKSRFLGFIKKVKTEDEAIEFINAMKKKYWDARHNCMAYVIEGDQEIKRFSDDGEPQGTAGKPILDVLERQNIKNAVIVVTRYFGGVLLGTGGLVRAYTEASVEAVKNAKICEVSDGVRFNIEVDYTSAGKISYYLRQNGGHEVETTYGENVIIDLIVDKTDEKALEDKVTEITSAQARFISKEDITYGICGDEYIWEL
ncbi:uncharacterized protein, YigZ family [Eubacterium uniforme]|uniref:Uncharacterized protein, YigZ family n=1 Tax=Eubacterium uniforme TaxID=39495 RepID=A0A1T4VY87_9FIRM|nr:YigZ family protein [Eubacterium uniforme]SKA69461.1 uncharacterized protein, YigZ family [Eubacterium uniforme]